MALLDLLGQRWCLRVLWELRQDTLTFRELQAACGNLSPSVLNRRLQELKAAALVCNPGHEGYQLTELGRTLLLHLKPLSDWSEQWGNLLKNQITN